MTYETPDVMMAIDRLLRARRERCEACGGNGRVEMLEHCPTCKGEGTVAEWPEGARSWAEAKLGWPMCIYPTGDTYWVKSYGFQMSKRTDWLPALTAEQSLAALEDAKLYARGKAILFSDNKKGMYGAMSFSPPFETISGDSWAEVLAAVLAALAVKGGA